MHIIREFTVVSWLTVVVLAISIHAPPSLGDDSVSTYTLPWYTRIYIYIVYTGATCRAFPDKYLRPKL